MAVKMGSYKGHATITLNPEARFPFTFGVEKAKLILDNLDAIKAFAGAPKAQPDPTDMAYEDACAAKCGGGGGL